MSLPLALAESTLDRLLARHTLTETTDTPLVNAMSPDPVGRIRVFRGDGGVAKVVYVGLVVPMFQLDSHMVFAFTPGDSAVPHFTLDSVYGGAYHAFHLDLIPRAPLATHLSYVDSVFSPLTPVFDAVSARDGLTAAAIGPRQRAIMSPWMLVHRASEEAFASLTDDVFAYLDHWSGLIDKGLPADVLDTLADTNLPAHDDALRDNLFNPDVDPVWSQVARLLGQDGSDAIRGELLRNGS